MILFEHTVPLWLLAVVLVLGLLAGCWSAWRHLPRNAGNAAITVLYLAALALLGWCLLLPGRKETVTRVIKPRFLVLLDTSRSMTLSPDAAISNRWTFARQALALPWLRAVTSECEVEVFPFGAELGSSVTPAAAAAFTPGAASTRLRDALKEIGARFNGVNVAGALLLTDGLDTQEATSEWASESRAFPLYTVRLEPADGWKDEINLHVDTVTTPKRVSAGWKTELKTSVGGEGRLGAAVSVQLLKDGVLQEEKPTQIPPGGGSRELTFELDHPDTGIFNYRVFIPAAAGETNTNDNEVAVSVQVTDAKNRLLYVEGVPRWEYKYLKRALQANRQAAPVIFHTGPDGKPQGGMSGSPVTADMSPDQLALFKIVLIGNLTAAELGEGRAKNLVDFVDAGGSLVLLGGSGPWGTNGMHRTALGPILPVRTPPKAALAGEKPFPVRLTDAARAHPAFAGDAALWEIVPPILTVFPGASLAPAAEVLAEAETPQGAQPVIVTHRHGQGKVVVLLTDSLWRWQLSPEAARNRPYVRFWGQLISSLLPKEEELADGGIDLFSDQDQVFLGGEVALTARANSKDPADVGRVQVRLTLPDGRQVPYAMSPEAVTTATGRSFQGHAYRFNADTPGLYKAEAEAVIAGATVRSDPVAFHVKPFSPETNPRPVRTDLLEALSTASGGRFFPTLDDLDAGLSALQFQTREEETSVFNTLWRTWGVVIALMLLFTAAWFLRKSRNMP